MHGQGPLTRRVHIGAGVLGGLLIEQHKKKYPEATIIAETRTTSKHADLRSKVIVRAHVYLHKTPFQGECVCASTFAIANMIVSFRIHQ
jgi:pyrroline-5-carboxylate reductase